MVSTASTVTELFMPETVRLAQWPVMTIVLEIPLTVTSVSLHPTVLFSLTPETLSSPPGGGRGNVDGPALGVRVALPEGVGLRGLVFCELVTCEVLGIEEEMIERTPESRFAA